MHHNIALFCSYSQYLHDDLRTYLYFFIFKEMQTSGLQIMSSRVIINYGKLKRCLTLFLEPEWALSRKPMTPKAEWTIDSQAIVKSN